MGNSYFQFKQFIVNQEKCAMKVCTDACVFGAYISLKEKDVTNDETNILDIGTGTGLLSLMIAQKVKGNIDVVEIDENAFEQARENFKNSLWQSRLSVTLADITKLRFQKKYDVIISNPPFFENALKSNNKQRNIAKHATSLPYAALASIAYSNLATNGRFYILLPFSEFQAFEKTATKNQLMLHNKMNIRQSKSSDYFRTIGVFSNTQNPGVIEDAMAIRNDNDKYSEDFIELLKDYYLYL